MWDVFISHASEDKQELARPLAEELRGRGLSVWYDEFSLKIGDSLRESIDRGLAESRFGVVILSLSFFAKKWTQRELDGLTTREIPGGKVILPIWHGVSQGDVAAYSPVLADRIAVDSVCGLVTLADEIEKEVRGNGPDPIPPEADNLRNKGGSLDPVLPVPAGSMHPVGSWFSDLRNFVTRYRKPFRRTSIVLAIIIAGVLLTKVVTQRPSQPTVTGDEFVRGDRTDGDPQGSTEKPPPDTQINASIASGAGDTIGVSRVRRDSMATPELVREGTQTSPSLRGQALLPEAQAIPPATQANLQPPAASSPRRSITDVVYTDGSTIYYDPQYDLPGACPSGGQALFNGGGGMPGVVPAPCVEGKLIFRPLTLARWNDRINPNTSHCLTFAMNGGRGVFPSRDLAGSEEILRPEGYIGFRIDVSVDNPDEPRVILTSSPGSNGSNPCYL